jgi:fibronectin type 3 domain-containing protein
MKRFGFSITALFAALFAAAALVGCRNMESTDTPDTTAPVEVSDLAAEAGDKQVVLSWTDPSDKDLAYIEIRFTPAAIGVAQPIKVNKGVQTKTISGLENGVLYEFTLKAVDTAGNQSAGISISQMPVVYQIELSQTAPYDFTGTNRYYIGSYTPPSLTVTVTNTGNRATGALTITLTGEDAGSFTLSLSSISSIAVGAAASFTVYPKSNLAAAKTHYAEVSVSGGNGISAYFEVSFTLLQGEYGISLSRTGWYDQTAEYDFSASGMFYNTGYTQPEALSLTVTNIGKQPTGALTVNLSGEDADRFTLSRTNLNSLAAGSSDSFTVRPKAGISIAKTHSAAATVTGNNGISADWTVRFTVTQKAPTAAAQPAGSIALSWDAVPGASLYKVCRAAASDGEYSEIGTTVNTSYSDTELASGTVYYYKIKAVHGGVEGALSDYATALTFPGVPGGLTAIEQSASSIALSWDAVTGATSYKVYRAVNADGEYSCMATTGNTSYVDTGISDGTTYYYKVSAVNSVGEGILSTYVVCMTIDTPNGLTATAQNTNSITLSWNIVSGAASYKVYRSASADGEYSYVGTSESASYTDTGLSIGTTYYYKVSALNSEGEESPSGYVSGTTYPGVPTGLTATAWSTSYIQLEWNAVTGATYYKVYRSASYDGAYSLVTTVTGNSYTNTGLSTGTTYYYKVSAVYAVGEGSLSGYVSGTTYPGVPTGLTATAQSTSSIQLEWNAVTGATYYKVYQGSEYTLGYSLVTTVSGTSYTNTGLSSNTAYSYLVSAVNSGGEGSSSDGVSATTLLWIDALYAIGDTGPAGGLIFWADVTGFVFDGVTYHYLEVAPEDLGSYQWGGYGTACGTGTAIGTGIANTAELVTHDHGTPSSGSGLHLAARACADYSYGGYDDWFLPSLDEMCRITYLKAQVFSSTYYWSSSEISSSEAWRNYFGIGIQYQNYLKHNGFRVRPVRAF